MPREKAPEIDEIGPDQEGVFRHREGLSAIDAVNRLVDPENEMIGMELGEPLRTPADTATGVEDQRRFPVPVIPGRHGGGAGRAVVVENGLPEGMCEMATHQRLEVAMWRSLRTGDAS
jgi:hypothetical protein